MIDARYTVDKCGEFWEVFDKQEKIVRAVSEDRSRAIIIRNYLNGHLSSYNMESQQFESTVPIELIEPER